MMPRLVHIEIDDRDLPPPTPEVEQERKVAIFDLLEDNTFSLVPRDGTEMPAGPYRLQLAIRDRRLVFELASESHEHIGAFHLSLSPFRQVVKDYYQIRDAYHDAVKKLPPSQIEAIDMARRGIRNEGARVLQARLDGKAKVELDTSRRRVTLICVLHFGV